MELYVKEILGKIKCCNKTPEPLSNTNPVGFAKWTLQFSFTARKM